MLVDICLTYVFVAHDCHAWCSFIYTFFRELHFTSYRMLTRFNLEPSFNMKWIQSTWIILWLVTQCFYYMYRAVMLQSNSQYANFVTYFPHCVLPGNNTEAQAFLSRHSDSGNQVIVRMRGLPYTCTAEQVVSIICPPIYTCCPIRTLHSRAGILNQWVKNPVGVVELILGGWGVAMFSSKRL